MTIYSSDKAVPYVYICTNKETNQFYIGYREKNVKLNICSHLDLPEYKTSSKIINPDWSNYTWTIVAEFFDPSHAYTFEQQLICDNWDNPLLLNGYYRLGDHTQFRNSGPSKKKGNPSGKQRNPYNQKGILKGPNGKKGMPSGRKGIPSPLKGKPSGRKGELRGKQQDPSNKPSPKKGKSSPLKGRTSPLKGIPNGKKGIPTGPRGPYTKVECPHCGEMVGNKRYHFDNCSKKLPPIS